MDYRNKYYTKYLSENAHCRWGETTMDRLRKQFPAFKKYFESFLPHDKKAALLDLGCGCGDLVHWLQQRGYTDVVGIDISEERIAAGKKLNIPNICCRDVRQFLKNAPQAYKVIFARDFLEHFNKEEIEEISTLVYSVLADDGLFVIKAPNGESIFGARYRYGDFSHEITFTRNSLAQIMKAAGFRETECKPAGPVAHGIVSCVRYVLWKCIEAVLHFYMLIETGSPQGIFTQNLICVARK